MTNDGDLPLPQSEGSGLTGFGEDGLVAAPAIEILKELGWKEHEDLQHEQTTPRLDQGRSYYRESAPKEWWLPIRLRKALKSLNPDLPEDALRQAYDELTRPRGTLEPIAANREVIELLRDGVTVQTKIRGERQRVTVRVIDWRNIEANDFFLASEVCFASDIYRRRADLVGFVNGLPLLFIELKNVEKSAHNAYEKNLRDYLDTIPHVFWANAFVILSSGLDTRIGGSHAPFRFFKPWKRLDEDDKGQVSLEVALKAACSPEKLLDMAENFLIFEETDKGLVKKVAQNHQVLGVNRAVEALKNREPGDGRLGVFWHTQGSGKSLSMLFFARKVLRRIGGVSFVLVTDRTELDEQLSETFAACGLLEKRTDEARAQSSDHLRRLLSGNERFVFTLIHKFRTSNGDEHPVLTERDDVIVIADEAHRSQYASLAANMRKALPNAAFIGFTGTPLMASDEQTRRVFGDYVSKYDFARSVEDGATVPLYCENRIPEVQLDSRDLDAELGDLLDDMALDEQQEEKLQQRLGRRYHVITRNDRLDKIAEDVVKHLPARGYRGKAMFVAIDKPTALRMHDKVRARWDAEVARLAELIEDGVATAADRERHAFMAETDMALVVSQGQNEVADMKKRGLDIETHRRRMINEDMEKAFKADDNPLRLVFVCAMWITGFDVPTCSTVYLDKPMQGHTLMQTIARANRTSEGKQAGVIVDYIGIFKKLQDALAIYATEGTDDEEPIEDKSALLSELEAAYRRGEEYAAKKGVDLKAIAGAEPRLRLGLVEDAEEKLSGTDEEVRGFLRLADRCWTLYQATLPDDGASHLRMPLYALRKLAQCLRRDLEPVDISEAEAAIERLLDEAIQGVTIAAPIRPADDLSELINLAALDMDKIRDAVGSTATKKRTSQLRQAVDAKVKKMAAANPIRAALVERFEELVAEYNAGNVTQEEHLQALLELLASMKDEERRAVRENLGEEELAIFDLLTTPGPDLTEEEREIVRQVAGDLLAQLKGEAFVLDFDLKERAKAQVRDIIRTALDDLPATYDKALYDEKVAETYRWIYQRYGTTR